MAVKDRETRWWPNFSVGDTGGLVRAHSPAPSGSTSPPGGSWVPLCRLLRGPGFQPRARLGGTGPGLSPLAGPGFIVAGISQTRSRVSGRSGFVRATISESVRHMRAALRSHILESMALANERVCTAIGRFNPAILSPEWVVKEGILPAGNAEVEALFGAVQLVRFHHAGLMWQPSLGKLTVQGESPDSNPGEFVAQILDRLSHTPVRAVGNNFEFEIADEAAAGRAALTVEAELTTLLAAEKPVLKYSATQTILHGEDCLLGITLKVEKDSPLTVQFNFHRDAASASTAAAAARHFGADQEEAKRLLEVILR